MSIRALLALALLCLPVAARAQRVDAAAAMASGGAVFGHLPYGDAPPEDLVEAPAGFAVGQPCLIRRAMLADLTRLLAAAQGNAAVMGQLRGLSCHRSIVRQAEVFCREHPVGGAAERAQSVAPPGHSEHATGYALDFAIRPAHGCPDAEACMAATPAARWLLANAPRFGFEMSFPGGNGQTVKWEPWHWRWVGTNGDARDAAAARMLFATARRRFPARPAVPALAIRVVAQPDPPAVAAAPAPRPVRRR